MNIQEKIKELGLVPLFPDYYYFDSSKKNKNDDLKITSDEVFFRQKMTFVRYPIGCSFYSSMEIISDNFDTEMHFLINNFEEGDYKFRDDYADLKFNNLPDVLNFFNEKYEIVAKFFNEMLLEKLKDELEEEKKKQDEKEKEEGEGMSSKDIEKLLEELKKDQKGKSQSGQSDNTGDEIDLEDFLDKVEKGEAENDFTKGYKDKELKDKIDYEKRGEKGEEEQDDMDFELPDFPEPQSNLDIKIDGVLNAIVDMLHTDREDIKRQFPTEKSVKSFVSLLSPNELDFIITQVGLSESLSRFEKQKLITSNFITELENI